MLSPLLEGPQLVRLAEGHFVAVIHKPDLLRISLHTAWGAVYVARQIYAMGPDIDGVNIVGRVTMGSLGINPNEELDWIARELRSLRRRA